MVFGTMAFTIQPGFYLFQVRYRNTKSTRARCKIYMKLTVMTPKRHVSGIILVFLL